MERNRDDSRIVSETSGSQIEDAEAAIFCIDSYYNFLEVESTVFNRNVLGIHLKNEPFAPHPPVLFKFSGNKFTCDAPINGTGAGVSEAGLKIKNIPTFIHPSFGAVSNQFRGLKYGVVVEGAASVISGWNFFFDRIFIDAISLENGRIDIKNSTFRNVEGTSIAVKKCAKANITSCNFIYTSSLPPLGSGLTFVHRYGLKIDELLAGCEVAASGWTFNADFGAVPFNEAQNKNIIGVYINGNNAGSGVKVRIGGGDLNTWNINSIAGRAIVLSGTFPIDASLQVFYNHFKIENKYSNLSNFTEDDPLGILCSGGDKHNLKIYANTFTKGSWMNDAVHGMLLTGSAGTGNDISDNQFLSPYDDGIQVTGFKNSLFCSNRFYDGIIGFRFSGQNDDTEFMYNVTHFSRLVHVAANSYMDDQDNNGNQWFYISFGSSAFYVSPQARCETASFAGLSRFKVHTPQSGNPDQSGSFFSEYHPFSIVPDNADEWFEYDPNGMLPTTGCVNQVTGGGGVKKVGRLTSDGGLSQFSGDPVFLWEAEKHLYARLSDAPSLVAEHASFPAFKSGRENSTMGKLYEIKHGIDHAHVGLSALLGQISALSTSVDALTDSIRLIDASAAASSDPSMLQGLFLQKQGAVFYMNALLEEAASLHAQYADSILVAYAEILNDNNAISTSQSHEQYEVAANAIFLETFTSAVHSVPAARQQQLRQIAALCPREGGSAVYRARSLLPSCEHLAISDFTSGCYPIEEIEGRSQQDSTESNAVVALSVFPNPSSGAFDVRLPSGKTDAIVSVVNNLGQIVAQQGVAAQESRIRFSSSLPNGVYWVVVKYVDGSSDSSGLVIIN